MTLVCGKIRIRPYSSTDKNRADPNLVHELQGHKNAPIAQRIEHSRPKGGMQVRFLLGAQTSNYSSGVVNLRLAS